MAATTESLFRGKTDELPSRIDLTSRISPEAFERERERIFKRSWMAIGHTQDLPNKGSYFVHELPMFGISLLVVRGQDEQVRVFHNVCRHRGNKLVREGSGTRPIFSCNFHGWAFTTEGQLRLITDEAQFENVDKEKLELIPVHTEVWNTLIFINLDTKPRWTLAEWLGEFYGQYDGYFEQHERAAAYKTEVKCNWHLAVNSFTEGYHTLYLHKSTARDYQGGRTNPQRHRPTIEIFERHHRYSAPGNPDHRYPPGEAIAAKYGRKMLPAFDFDCTGMPPGINPSKHDKWAFDVIEIFPNIVMLAGNSFHNEISFWPIDHERTLVVNQGWTYKPRNLGERLSRSYFRARVRDVFREDLNTLEAQQAVMATGVMPEVILSRQEMALRHHYKVSDAMLETEK